jgi:hypothetical protein
MSKQLLKARSRLEAKIEELIALLDLLDGDPDVEDNGDEHDVGMPIAWCASSYASGQTLILEDDEDGGDAEPNGDEADTSFTEDEWGCGTCH